MEWSKIKTIIILILATVNLFLLAFLGLQTWQSNVNEVSAQQELVAVLGDNGITMETHILPPTETLPMGIATRSVAEERTVAQGLLQGGDSLVEDGTTYIGTLGTARFYANGELYAQFHAGAYGSDDGLAVLTAMGLTGQVVLATPNAVVVQQTMNGAPIFDCLITLPMENGQFTGISSGSRLLLTQPQMEAGDCLSIDRVLLFFLDAIRESGDLCSEIINIELGYRLDSQSMPSQLVPCWRITTTAGVNQGHYLVDAISGAVINQGK